MACRIRCLPTDEEGTIREDRRPIGYWLKHLDGLLEGAFDRTLAGQGVTRRHWAGAEHLARAAFRPGGDRRGPWRHSSPTIRAGMHG
jgi:hypothetical protein